MNNYLIMALCFLVFLCQNICADRVERKTEDVMMSEKLFQDVVAEMSYLDDDSRENVGVGSASRYAVTLLSRRKTPASIAAFVRLMVHPNLIEHDARVGLPKGDRRLRVKIAAHLMLSDLETLPLITGGNPEHSRARIVDTYLFKEEELLAEVGEWCEQVVRGERTMKFSDRSGEYDAFGKNVETSERRVRSGDGQMRQRDEVIDSDKTDGRGPSSRIVWSLLAFVSAAVAYFLFQRWKYSKA